MARTDRDMAATEVAPVVAAHTTSDLLVGGDATGTTVGPVLRDGPGAGGPPTPEAVPWVQAPAGPMAPEPATFPGEAWVHTPRPVPSAGWRRGLWSMTGGRVNPGPDAEEARVRQWIDQVRRPFGGTRTVAVVSTKGGVGKTTTTVNLGHALASVRGDRVVALDANPDAGSLGYRVTERAAGTASDLLREADYVFSYSDVRHFTAKAASNLEVVASADDPTLTQHLERADYERLLNVLRIHYNLVLADCGTGILDEATQGVVGACDQLVVVTGPSVDAARAVTYLLDWLRQHDLGELAAEAVVVVNGVRHGRRPVDLGAMVGHFQRRVRSVLTVPWDAELANGAAVELDWLAPPTRQAYVRLAAEVVRGFVDGPATTIDATGSTA